MDRDDWLNECRAQCRRVKFLADQLDWSERPNHSSWMVATSALLDENRETIPSLYFKGEYMPGPKGDKISYALMFTAGRKRHRVFMLEVYPPHVVAHTEGNIRIFGPHIHLGDDEFKCIVRGVIANIADAFSHRWVERFQRHARISDDGPHRVGNPFKNDLFGSP